MSKDKPKGLFADVGDESDWDKALDAWELTTEPPPPPLPPPQLAPPSGPRDPNEQVTTAPPASALGTPTAPPAPGALPRFDEYQADERTVITQVSPELLERASAAALTGSGLGQAFRGTRAEAAPSESRKETTDGEEEKSFRDPILDALLETPGTGLAEFTDDKTIVTSPPALMDVPVGSADETRPTSLEGEPSRSPGKLPPLVRRGAGLRSSSGEQAPTVRPVAPLPGGARAGSSSVPPRPSFAAYPPPRIDRVLPDAAPPSSLGSPRSPGSSVRPRSTEPKVPPRPASGRPSAISTPPRDVPTTPRSAATGAAARPDDFILHEQPTVAKGRVLTDTSSTMPPRPAVESAPPVAIQLDTAPPEEGADIVAQTLLEEGGQAAEEPSTPEHPYLAEVRAWVSRASWLEEEARLADLPGERARGLLLASELFLVAGDRERGEGLAMEARALAPERPLAHRMTRAGHLARANWAAALDGLRTELASTPAGDAKAQAALLAAQLERVADGDPDRVRWAIDEAAAAQPRDPRPLVARVAMALAEPEAIAPEGLDASGDLARAFEQVRAWRGLAPSQRDESELDALEALEGVRRALRSGDLASAVSALVVLGRKASVEEPARWLAATLALNRPELADQAREQLTRLAEASSGSSAWRALLALETAGGDADRVLGVLRDAPITTFSPSERLAAFALSGASSDALRDMVGKDPGDPSASRLWPAALQAARPDSEPVGPDVFSGPMSPEEVRVEVGRLLGSAETAEGTQAALEALSRIEEEGTLGHALCLDIELEARRIAEFPTHLAALAQAGACADVRRDPSLVSGLLLELGEKQSDARRHYEAAREADPSFEGAARAQAACSDPIERPGILIEHEATATDPQSAALLILEAALSGTDPETYADLLQRAHDRCPELPFASWLAERRARARGETDAVLRWVRERREQLTEPAEIAVECVREAMLVRTADPDAMRLLLERASRARPDDLALRELWEASAAERPDDRFAYWTERASAAAGTDRSRIALLVALEHDVAGRTDAALEAAQMAAEAAPGDAMVRLALERAEAGSGGAAQLVERLVARAHASQDRRERAELYRLLAHVEEYAREDLPSALLWYRSVLEEEPQDLASLCKLEQLFVRDGREEELARIALTIGEALGGLEASAHAALAARLIAKLDGWAATDAAVRLAFRQPRPTLWALREMEAHALYDRDAQAELLATRALTERTTRSLETTTLYVRAAEAARRTSDVAAARQALELATRLDPSHPVAALMLVHAAREEGDLARAAEASETLAGQCAVAAHQLAAWYDAGVLWSDLGTQPLRARAALEHVAEVDVMYRDVFERLEALYGADPDGAARAATLFERRLEKTTDSEERVRLEVLRGRALAGLGDRDTAKRALARALEQRPDHVEALAAFAEVCTQEEDWTGAEQALIRLARLVPESADQAALYHRLARIYDLHSPNLERAELAYREVLRRIPDDVPARERLVDVCARAGAFDRAIEAEQGLLAAAEGPEVRAKRLVELALLFERSGEIKRGEATLEGARKEFPADPEILTALTDLYRRSGREAALQILLDRVSGDARRALSTGRFDLSLFRVLARTARLRGRAAAADLVDATVQALEGQPSLARGAGARAAERTLDDRLAPDVLTPAFRSLLAKTGELLDLVAPLSLQALRAAPMPHQPVLADIRMLASALGLGSIDVLVSPVYGAVCVPVSSRPAQIVLGAPLLEPENDAVRGFLLLRSLKIVQAHACALARSAPIDLLPLVSAYLQSLAPSFTPVGIDLAKLAELRARVDELRPRELDPEVATLALEVAASLGNRASTLNTVVSSWGNRVALLAFGDLSLGFSAIARAAGHASGPAASGQERLTWVGRNAEARDLAVFSVSDAYAELRAELAT